MKCIKCGSVDIATQYHANNLGYVHMKSPATLRCPQQVNSEHLFRYCRNCSYGWTNPCDDSLGSLTLGKGE